jgi:hypothetical protein
MQFMVIRKADAATEAGLPPHPRMFEDMERFNQKLHAAGGVRLALGLHPSAGGVRLKLGAGGETLTDGPFTETRELVAGFTIFEAASKEAAIELLKGWPASDAETSGAVTLELRETGCPGGCLTVPPAQAGDGERYLILLRATAATECEAVPPPETLAALNAFNAAQAAAGRLLAGDGLTSSSRGARLRLQGGRASVIDGPFAEAKELIAGFWMIRAHSMEDAVAWARTVPYPTGPEVEVEIRKAFSGAELDAMLAAGQARQDAGLRAEQLDSALRGELAGAPVACGRP